MVYRIKAVPYIQKRLENLTFTDPKNEQWKKIILDIHLQYQINNEVHLKNAIHSINLKFRDLLVLIGGIDIKISDDSILKKNIEICKINLNYIILKQCEEGLFTVYHSSDLYERIIEIKLKEEIIALQNEIIEKSYIFLNRYKSFAMCAFCSSSLMEYEILENKFNLGKSYMCMKCLLSNTNKDRDLDPDFYLELEQMFSYSSTLSDLIEVITYGKTYRQDLDFEGYLYRLKFNKMLELGLIKYLK